MPDLNAILHRLRLASDANAPKVLKKFLVVVAAEALNGQFRTALEEFIRRPFTRNYWADLHNLLHLWTAGGHQVTPDWYVDSLDSLAEMASYRQERLDCIALTVTPGAMRYVPQFTNLNKSQFRQKIKSLSTRLEYGVALSDQPSSSDFLQALKALRTACFDPPLGGGQDRQNLLDEVEALFGVCIQYDAEQSSRQKRKRYALPGFRHCAKCWRLIPESRVRKGRDPLCDAHNYAPTPSTTYKKATTVQKKLWPDTTALTTKVTGILALLQAGWKARYEGITVQEWEDLWAKDLSRLTEMSLPPVVYDLEPLWSACPNVKAHVLKNDGDPNSPESILSILDPHMAGETETERQQREALQAVFAINFSYYRYELAMAEAWLSAYDDEYRGRTHGGKRSNAGGKRSGSGRHRKKSLV